jgi:Zn-finger nucleic acid-binding protein
MTSATKQYIDFDDLVAVVITCKLCQASLSLRLDADRMQLPPSCPSCQGVWNTMQRGAIGSQVSLFRDATKQLKETLRVTSADLNLTMQIEIKDASHASDEPSNPS